MGGFNKKRNIDENTWAAAEALRYIKNSPEPLFALSLILIIIKKDKILSDVELEAIGLDANEQSFLLDIFANNENDLEKKEKLFINANLRLVDKEIYEVFQKNKIFDYEGKKRELAARLAKYAYDNKIDNLESAFRLMIKDSNAELDK